MFLGSLFKAHASRTNFCGKVIPPICNYLIMERLNLLISAQRHSGEDNIRLAIEALKVGSTRCRLLPHGGF